MSTRDVLDRTEMINPRTFADLKRLRMEYVQASRRNGADVGMKKLLTDLYPGRAHFIYELIQNADDAGATEVEVELRTNGLSFSHNGSRLFNLDDIKSITNVGQSTKKADGTTIGKFGVGFKSVYSYTSHPVINSGEFHFQIYEMMIPEEIDETNPYYSSYKHTEFVLPFDLSEKSAEKSCQEIQEALSNFSEETILFLRNIKNITFEVSGDSFEISKKEKEHLVVLKHESAKKASSKFYLKFSKITKVETLDGLKNLPVDIAYRLESKENLLKTNKDNLNKSLSDKYLIVPIETGNSVYISFLAEKEHSGLNFCINSFFSTTPSRDSLRDTDDNRALIRELVKLQEETLKYIRDNGFLNIEFLKVLPNSKDNLKDFYRPFYINTLRLFRKEAYMITKNDSYIPSTCLLSGTPSAITDIFTIGDVMKMSRAYSKCTIEGWSRNSSQKNSREDIFISDLKINKWSIDDFISFISYPNNSDIKTTIEILKTKTVKQIFDLYYLIAESKTSRCYINIRDSPIFKLVNGDFASINDKVYILDDWTDDKEFLSRHNFILPDLYLGKGSKKEVVLSFLKNLGICHYTSDALCEEILDKYNSDNQSVDISEHIADIETLVKYHKLSPDVFNHRKILRSDKGEYCYSNELFLSAPYQKPSELHDLAIFLGIFPLSKIYKEKLQASSLEVFLTTLKTSNIATGLTVEKVPARYNPLYFAKLHSIGRTSWREVDRDYTIKGLDSILASVSATKKASRLIWTFLLSVPDECLIASYSPNGSCSTRHCPSQFVQLLTRSKWLLHSDGNLYLPEATTFEDLPNKWKKPKANNPYNLPALKAVGFGKKLECILQDSREKEAALKALGVTKTNVEIAKKLSDSGYTLEEFQDFILYKRHSDRMLSMPVDNSANPERRVKVVTEQIANAENQVRVIRERSVRTSEDKSRVKMYLKRMYTDDDDYLRCQMCRDMMPFKRKNGEFYFEAIQISQNMRKEFPAQYLCLCPNCAAEFSEWVINGGESKNFIQEIIRRDTALTNGEIVVSIQLSNGKKLNFYFTQKHFIDIKVALKEWCRESDNYF